MAEKNDEKYIVTNLTLPKGVHEAGQLSRVPIEQSEFSKAMQRVVYLDDNIVPGSFYVEAVWFVDKIPESVAHGGHVHDFDEVIGFIGSNMKDPSDLGGEVEIWLEGNKHIINKSCVVFVPKGMHHCPIIFRRVDTPIFHFATANAKTYSSTPPT